METYTKKPNESRTILLLQQKMEVLQKKGTIFQHVIIIINIIQLQKKIMTYLIIITTIIKILMDKKKINFIKQTNLWIISTNVVYLFKKTNKKHIPVKFSMKIKVNQISKKNIKFGKDHDKEIMNPHHCKQQKHSCHDHNDATKCIHILSFMKHISQSI